MRAFDVFQLGNIAVDPGKRAFAAESHGKRDGNYITYIDVRA